MTDEEYLTLFRQDAERGLSLIMDQYLHLVAAIIKARAGNIASREDIKECISDVFLSFYQNRTQIDLQKGSIKAYLAKIAVHHGIDLYRKLFRLQYKESSIEEIKQPDTTLTTSASVEQAVLQQEEKSILYEALSSLGEPDCEIFIRRYYLGQKSKEIAENLQLTPNTVDKKISRGLIKLRNLLGGEKNEY